MPDWTADDIARDIERRRGGRGPRAAPRDRSAEDQMSDWSDADWCEAFERRHGLKASPRFGKTRVRETDIDGAVLRPRRPRISSDRSGSSLAGLCVVHREGRKNALRQRGRRRRSQIGERRCACLARAACTVGGRVATIERQRS